uniref:Uncharacterized protein n=1 Tax=Arion vulgaris TaxID=1028688 RepID=A0A0B7ASI8_9EUPU
MVQERKDSLGKPSNKLYGEVINIELHFIEEIEQVAQDRSELRNLFLYLCNI